MYAQFEQMARMAQARGLGWFLIAAAVLGVANALDRRNNSSGSTSPIDVAVILLYGLPQCLLVASMGVLSQLLLSVAMRRPRGLGSVAWSRAIAVVTAGALASIPPLAALRQDAAWLAACMVASIYVLCESAARGLEARSVGIRSQLRGMVSRWRRFLPLLAAEASTAGLTVVVFPLMGAWSLVLSGSLVLLIRVSAGLLTRMRETYRLTIEVLLEAAEGGRPEKRGHADRTAATARSIALECGLSIAAVERIEYAALLHDLGEIGGSGTAVGVIEDVHFFSDVLPVLALCDGSIADTPTGGTQDAIAAFIVALSSDIDDMTSAGGQTVGTALSRVVPVTPPDAKATAVAAALRLGLRIPGIA